MLRCFDSHILIFLKKIFFGHCFENLKPNSQETASNVEKRGLQKCLRIAFTPLCS
jgi:hypothetical protein